jgi:hypothetical protein
VAADDVEFMRWRAERWMKLQHFPAALRHSPFFCLRHGAAMIAHTFAGTTWRSAAGLEPERAAFDRFRTRRRHEREWPGLDPQRRPGVALAPATA